MNNYLKQYDKEGSHRRVFYIREYKIIAGGGILVYDI